MRHGAKENKTAVTLINLGV